MDIKSVLENESSPLPVDLEVLVNLNLFTETKIQNIKKMREAFNSIKFSMEDFTSKSYLEYIAFECKLLESVTDLCLDGLELEAKTRAKECLTSKINKMYQDALRLYPNVEKIYTNYFEFCKTSNQILRATPYLYKFIEFHGDKPQTWVIAAQWEYYEFKKPEKGNTLFYDGLSRHPNSKEIYKAFFKAELEEAANLIANQNHTDDLDTRNSMALKEISKLYEHCKTRISDLKCLVELLEIMTNYDFTNTLQNEIVWQIADYFPGDELTWHTLAQRELNGYHVNDVIKLSDVEAPIDNAIYTRMTVIRGIAQLELVSYEEPPPVAQYCEWNKERTVLNIKDRTILCYKIYARATQILPTQNMWTYFINAMFDLNKSDPSELNYSLLLAAHKMGDRASMMTEVQYLRYVKQLTARPDPNESPDCIERVLERAITVHPKSIVVYFAIIKYYFEQNNEKKIDKHFAAAIQACDAAASFTLWKLYHQYLLITTSTEGEKKLEDFFVEAINQVKPISSHFQIEYIDWLASVRGLRRTQKVFYKLTKTKKATAPYALYKKMLEIYENRVIHNFSDIEPEADKTKSWKNYTETIDCYNYTLERFGKTQPDLWLKNMMFHRLYGDAKEITNLLKRAMLELDPKHVDTFLCNYDRLILNYKHN